MILPINNIKNSINFSADSNPKDKKTLEYDHDTLLPNNPYTYTVVETPVDGFETSYENNDGITDGIITVINKETAVYILPETGGTGAWRILALALVTLFLGTLCVLQIRRARRSRH